MSINAELYVIAEDAKKTAFWRRKDESSAKLGDKPGSHAERALLDNNLAKLGGKPVLIVQNAYPCTGKDGKGGCHGYFTTVSGKGVDIILKVTDDQGCYGAEHGFPLNGAPVPTTIYYRGGASKIVPKGAKDATPPAGFPKVPDFSGIAL